MTYGDTICFLWWSEYVELDVSGGYLSGSCLSSSCLSSGCMSNGCLSVNHNSLV
jgi:hypothetical protein